MREVEPGEMVVVDAKGLRSVRPFTEEGKRFCVFEHVYFARPDSVHRRALGLSRPRGAGAAARQGAPRRGRRGHPRARLGHRRGDRLLARERHPLRHGPDPLALRRPHVHRAAAVDPPLRREAQAQRRRARCCNGKRVVVVDDSIVRGTTSRKIVKMLRSAGAREVHVRISSPPTTHPCFYGIDTPTRSELIASSHTPDEIARYITCDTLGYLSARRDDGGGRGRRSIAGQEPTRRQPLRRLLLRPLPDRVQARHGFFAPPGRQLAAPRPGAMETKPIKDRIATLGGKIDALRGHL